MKNEIEQLFLSALASLSEDVLPRALRPRMVSLERPRERGHGDFACNLAMTLAKAARCKPRDLAQHIVNAIPASPWVAKLDLAGPGFINVFLSPTAYYHMLQTAVAQGTEYGRCALGNRRKALVEFVSANPTGPLHVGHGRGAAYGASLANLLAAAGYEVTREYYINDAGRQMDILALSVWLRYLDRLGETLPFPSNGYRGEYVYEIADALAKAHGRRLHRTADAVFADLPTDEPDGGDKEVHVDALIARAKALLGTSDYRVVFDAGLTAILDDIHDDLAEFRVTYDRWYSERSLVESGAVEKAIAALNQAGHLYTQDGARWFRSTTFGDEKDRVVVRENGATTYFAADLAYHMDKYQRGFDCLVDIWGADHHGYVPRVKAGLTALGYDANALTVQLVQFAILYRGKEKVSMSTRAGEFVTLRQLREEVSNDAARFFYVMRSHDQHLDFDLELAKSESSDNPVYYVQYAHARIYSVFSQLPGRSLSYDAAQGAASLDRLTESHEQELMVAVSRYPEVVESAARAYSPHQIAHYLRELAQCFHTYYNACTFLVEDAPLRNARLYLIGATRQVLMNGLILLDVSAPESM